MKHEFSINGAVRISLSMHLEQAGAAQDRCRRCRTGAAKQGLSHRNRKDCIKIQSIPIGQSAPRAVAPIQPKPRSPNNQSMPLHR